MPFFVSYIKLEDGDFSLDTKAVSKHINNSLKEEYINSTVAKIATVQIEGKRPVTRKMVL